jgi:CRISPR-associated endoribonuclease Cas6
LSDERNGEVTKKFKNMRFQLTLQVPNKQFRTIPLNYQYELSSLIYKTIAKGSQEYAEWLHQNGFQLGEKQFRMFTFSNLIIPKKKIDIQKETIEIESETITLELAFLPERSTEEFIKGVFSDRTFSIGNKQTIAEFAVQSIELQPQPNFSQPMFGRMESPLCITKILENRTTKYIMPDEEEASELLKNNLLRKYEAFYGKPFAEDLFFVWEATGSIKSKLIKIKTGTPQQTKVRGAICTFRLFTHPELLKIAYNAGLGEKNSMGFGCVGIGKTENYIKR